MPRKYHIEFNIPPRGELYPIHATNVTAGRYNILQHIHTMVSYFNHSLRVSSMGYPHGGVINCLAVLHHRHNSYEQVVNSVMLFTLPPLFVET